MRRAEMMGTEITRLPIYILGGTPTPSRSQIGTAEARVGGIFDAL